MVSEARQFQQQKCETQFDSNQIKSNSKIGEEGLGLGAAKQHRLPQVTQYRNQPIDCEQEQVPTAKPGGFGEIQPRGCPEIRGGRCGANCLRPGSHPCLRPPLSRAEFTSFSTFDAPVAASCAAVPPTHLPHDPF